MNDLIPSPDPQPAVEEPAPVTPPGLWPEVVRPNGRDWLELVLYILVGPGLFILAAVGLGYLVKQQNLQVSNTVQYLLNIIFFAGPIFLFGVLPGRLTLRDLGLFPPRWRWMWMLLALVIVVVLLPIRALLALAVQYLLEGNLDSLINGARMQLLTPTEFSWGGMLVAVLMVGILVPIAEELFFRGAIFTWLRRHYGVWPAILVSSLVFALGHADTFVVILTSLVLGLVNAYVYNRTRSLWFPIAIHALNNSLAMILVYTAIGLQKFIGM